MVHASDTRPRPASRPGQGTVELAPAALSRLRRALMADRSGQVALLAASGAQRDLQLEEGTDGNLLDQELGDALAARTRLFLAEIDAALARLDEGSYGRCETCGEAIPLERLEAIPHARTCVGCPPARGWLL
jgi:RNA polymerase-binding transcription factor DksA